MRALIGLTLAAFVLFGLACHSSAQVEKTWSVSENPGTSVTFIDCDDVGNVYDVEQGSTSALINIFNLFGDLEISQSIPGTISAFCVDHARGDVLLGAGGKVYTVFWNGYMSTSTVIGTVLAVGLVPYDGTPVVVVTNDGNVYFTDLSGYINTQIGGVTSVSGIVDPSGNVIVYGRTGKIADGTSFAAMFSGSLGDKLWSRSYDDGALSGTDVVGFAETGNHYYLELYDHQETPTEENVSVDAINPSNQSEDLWQSPPINIEPAHFYVDSAQNMYLAAASQLIQLSPSSPTPGSVVWTDSIGALGLVFNTNGPTVETYDSASSIVQLQNLNPANGRATSSVSIPVPGAANVGPIAINGNVLAYGGTTGGTSSSSFIQGVVYGPALASVSCPATVVGGSALLLSLTLDEAAASPIELSLTSNDTSVISDEKLDVSQSTTFALDTAPVDVDTPVQISATMASPPVRRTVSSVVKTATVASLQLVAASQIATGTVTLTGKAGPSGKTVSLSSNNPAVTVPASVSLAFGSLSKSFTATLHSVSVSTPVTVTAKLGSTSQTATIVVSPATLSSLSLSPSPVVGGNNVEALVVLNAIALGETVVTLKSNSTDATVPASITIPAGASQMFFVVKTSKVTKASSATVTASLNSTTAIATLTVNP